HSQHFFFSSRRRHTRSKRDWSSDVCSSDLFSSPRARRLSVPIALSAPRRPARAACAAGSAGAPAGGPGGSTPPARWHPAGQSWRSEERRVGKEGKGRWPGEAGEREGGGEVC